MQPTQLSGAVAPRSANNGIRKAIATATARAALLGFEKHDLAGGGGLLRPANGAHIGFVRGIAALAAAITGFESAVNDTRVLVHRLRGAA